MKKSSNGRLIAALIFFVLAIGAAIAVAVMLVTGAANLRPFAAEGAWPAFIKALAFQNPTNNYFNYVAAGGIYGAALLFVIAFILILARRCARFFFLPIGGLFAAAVGFYALVAYTVDKADLTMILAFATAGVGLLVLILSFILPKRALKTQPEAVAVPEEAAHAEEPAEEPAAEESKEEESKEEPVEEPVTEEPVPEPEPEPEPESEPEPEPEPVEEVKEPEPEPEPAKEEEPVKEEPNAKPAAKKATAAPAPAPEAKKVVGKYEVFPEAGFFKYRLKANNGEILIVSNPYRTIESALAGIDTLKKNVPTGRCKVITDKNGFGQFRISTANDARLIATGEIYPSAAGAEKALNSVMKFYDAEKIVTLDEIPESEHREWPLEVEKLDPKTNGKIQIETNEEGKFQASLFANNGELLFATTTYSSRAALNKALENITAKLIHGGTVTIAKDKQDRYQFRLYSDNGMLLLMGETYPTYEAATKAAHSARNFVQGAKIG